MSHAAKAGVRAARGPEFESDGARTGLFRQQMPSAKLTIGFGPIQIPVCSQINNYDRDELWTSGALACGRTRRAVARIPQITSLDPGSPARSTGSNRGLHSAATHRSRRAPVPRAYQQITRTRVETACPSSKALSIPGTNPLAVVEDIAADNNWAFERSGEDEVTIVSKGDWTDYQLSFTWMGEIEALHLACAFDMKIPPARRAEVQRLIAGDQRAIVGRPFRSVDPHRHDHAPPGAGAAGRADRLDRAMREPCWSAPSTPASAITRRSSSWSGPARRAAEAMSAAMFDTEGEA